MNKILLVILCAICFNSLSQTVLPCKVTINDDGPNGSYDESEIKYKNGMITSLTWVYDGKDYKWKEFKYVNNRLIKILEYAYENNEIDNIQTENVEYNDEGKVKKVTHYNASIKDKSEKKTFEINFLYSANRMSGYEQINFSSTSFFDEVDNIKKYSYKYDSNSVVIIQRKDNKIEKTIYLNLSKKKNPLLRYYQIPSLIFSEEYWHKNYYLDFQYEVQSIKIVSDSDTENASVEYSYEENNLTNIRFIDTENKISLDKYYFQYDCK